MIWGGKWWMMGLGSLTSLARQRGHCWGLCEYVPRISICLHTELNCQWAFCFEEILMWGFLADVPYLRHGQGRGGGVDMGTVFRWISSRFFQFFTLLASSWSASSCVMIETCLFVVMCLTDHRAVSLIDMGVSPGWFLLPLCLLACCGFFILLD